MIRYMAILIHNQKVKKVGYKNCSGCSFGGMQSDEHRDRSFVQFKCLGGVGTFTNEKPTVSIPVHPYTTILRNQGF